MHAPAASAPVHSDVAPVASPAARKLTHYCFHSLGSWKQNASFLRHVKFGEQFLRRGIRVSYLLDDVPYNREQVRLPEGAKALYVAGSSVGALLRARRDALLHERPDVLHVLDPSPKSYLLLRKLPNQRIVVDFDEWHSQRRWPLWRKLLLQYVERWHRRHGLFTVVASRYMQDQFEQRFGSRPLYIPYAPLHAPAPVRDDLPSPFARPTVIYMGTLDPAYDLDLVMDAAALLKQRGVTVPFDIIGDGPSRPTWEQFIAQHDLADTVTLRGFLPDDQMALRLRHAHVLLFPIRPTPQNQARCPAKTYAYAQARRPVITCRVGEVPQVLGDAPTYVDPTPQAFADAIQAALDKPAPDVDYHVERHSWAAHADTLLAALAANGWSV